MWASARLHWTGEPGVDGVCHLVGPLDGTGWTGPLGTGEGCKKKSEEILGYQGRNAGGRERTVLFCCKSAGPLTSGPNGSSETGGWVRPQARPVCDRVVVGFPRAPYAFHMRRHMRRHAAAALLRESRDRKMKFEGLPRSLADERERSTFVPPLDLKTRGSAPQSEGSYRSLAVERERAAKSRRSLLCRLWLCSTHRTVLEYFGGATTETWTDTEAWTGTEGGTAATQTRTGQPTETWTLVGRPS